MTRRCDFLGTATGAGAAVWAGARFAESVEVDSRLEDSAYLHQRI
jgi:hypothetical protein